MTDAPQDPARAEVEAPERLWVLGAIEIGPDSAAVVTVTSARPHSDFRLVEYVRATAAEAQAAAVREGAAAGGGGAVAAHLARIPNHHPDEPMSDPVAQGYGNAALNIAHTLAALTRSTFAPDRTESPAMTDEACANPHYNRAPPSPATGLDPEAVEALAKQHDQKARAAMNQLSCGSENWEYRAADRAHDFHTLTAKALRSLSAELQRFREERSYVVGWNDGFAHGLSNPPQDWQPIRTAPKDGTFVDLWMWSNAPRHEWRETGVRWQEPGGWFRQDGTRADVPETWVHSQDASTNFRHEPTHWRLPPLSPHDKPVETIGPLESPPSWFDPRFCPSGLCQQANRCVLDGSRIEKCLVIEAHKAVADTIKDAYAKHREMPGPGTPPTAPEEPDHD